MLVTLATEAQGTGAGISSPWNSEPCGSPLGLHCYHRSLTQSQETSREKGPQAQGSQEPQRGDRLPKLPGGKGKPLMDGTSQEEVTGEAWGKGTD